MNSQCYEAPLPCTLRQAQGERKRIWGLSSLAVHPSTSSGRTEGILGDRLPRLFTLRQAQGERKRTLGIVFPGCRPSTGSGRTEAHLSGIVFPGCSSFDRLRANGSALRGSSSLCALFEAQGERKRTSCAPFDRLRANGSALWGSSSPAVHPSTGSGRTDYALKGIRLHSPSRRPRALQASRRSPLWHCLRAL